MDKSRDQAERDEVCPGTRQQREEVAQLLKETRGEGRRLLREERSALERQHAETEKSLRLLEDAMPLSDDEARILREQTDQRAPLAERRDGLRTREAALDGLLAMKTPGSLRVYPEDSLHVRMMENDVFVDDTCASWQLTLDVDTIESGWVDLEGGGRPLLRLNVKAASP